MLRTSALLVLLLAAPRLCPCRLLLDVSVKAADGQLTAQSEGDAAWWTADADGDGDAAAGGEASTASFDSQPHDAAVLDIQAQLDALHGDNGANDEPAEQQELQGDGQVGAAHSEEGAAVAAAATGSSEVMGTRVLVEGSGLVGTTTQPELVLRQQEVQGAGVQEVQLEDGSEQAQQAEASTVDTATAAADADADASEWETADAGSVGSTDEQYDSGSVEDSGDGSDQFGTDAEEAEAEAETAGAEDDEIDSDGSDEIGAAAGTLGSDGQYGADSEEGGLEEQGEQQMVEEGEEENEVFQTATAAAAAADADEDEQAELGDDSQGDWEDSNEDMSDSDDSALVGSEGSGDTDDNGLDDSAADDSNSVSSGAGDWDQEWGDADS